MKTKRPAETKKELVDIIGQLNEIIESLSAERDEAEKKLKDIGDILESDMPHPGEVVILICALEEQAHPGQSLIHESTPEWEAKEIIRWMDDRKHLQEALAIMGRWITDVDLEKPASDGPGARGRV